MRIRPTTRHARPIATSYYGTIDGERRHAGAVKRRTDRMAHLIVKKGNAPGTFAYQIYALNKSVYDLVNDALTTLGGDGNLTEALDIVERTHGWDTVPADVASSPRAPKAPAASPGAAPAGGRLPQVELPNRPCPNPFSLRWMPAGQTGAMALVPCRPLPCLR